MDIRCTRCLEPWDMDTLHETIEMRPASSLPYDKQFAAMRAEFNRFGCAAMYSETPATDYTCAGSSNITARAIVSELGDLLGDDIDGMASMLEDAELMGLLD